MSNPNANAIRLKDLPAGFVGMGIVLVTMAILAPPPRTPGNSIVAFLLGWVFALIPMWLTMLATNVIGGVFARLFNRRTGSDPSETSENANR